jgi:hypothetical protein
MRPGPLIAIYVVLLYTFLAPLVLFGIYVLFDTLGRSDAAQKKNIPGRNHEKKDPAVWTAQDIAAFVDQT